MTKGDIIMSKEEAGVEKVLLADRLNVEQQKILEKDKENVGGAIVLEVAQKEHVPSLKEQLQELPAFELADLSEVEKAVLESEVADAIVEPLKPLTTQQSLDNILLIQSRLDGMKKSLFQVISSLENNPSILSKWSRDFANISWFQKIGTGAVIPTLFIIGGLAASAPVAIIVGGGGSALLYSGAAVLLDDHHNQTKNHANELRSGISGLIDLFGHILFSLHELRNDLAEQVNFLTSENEKLFKNVEDLSVLKKQLADEVESLKNSNADYKVETNKLKITNEKLADTESKLNNALDKAVSSRSRTETLFLTMTEYDFSKKEERIEFSNSFESIKEKVDKMESVSSGLSQLQTELFAANEKLESSATKLEEVIEKNQHLVEKNEDLTKELNKTLAANNRQHDSKMARMEGAILDLKDLKEHDNERAQQTADVKKVIAHPEVQKFLNSMPEESASRSNAKILSQVGLLSGCAKETKVQNEQPLNSKVSVTTL